MGPASIFSGSTTQLGKESVEGSARLPVRQSNSGTAVEPPVHRIGKTPWLWPSALKACVFYDSVGLSGMSCRNHLPRVVALLAMEPPTAGHDEELKILRQVLGSRLKTRGHSVVVAPH